jgi:hypothetical protein
MFDVQEMFNFTCTIRQRTAETIEPENPHVTRGIILSQKKFLVSVANGLPSRGRPETGALMPRIREA